MKWFLAGIDVFSVKFHPFGRIGEVCPPELPIQSVRIAGEQNPAPQALQVGMRHYGFHQPFRKSMAAVCFEHVYVAEIGNGGEIGNDPGKPDLFILMVHPKAKRVFNCPFHRLPRNIQAPVMPGSTKNHESNGCQAALYPLRL